MLERQMIFELRGDEQRIIEEIKEYIPVEREDIWSWLCYFQNEILTSHIKNVDVDGINKNYKFALSKIMNTQRFISNGKMQYTTAGQIAKKALES